MAHSCGICEVDLPSNFINFNFNSQTESICNKYIFIEPQVNEVPRMMPNLIAS